jgi:hypothetical protein
MSVTLQENNPFVPFNNQDLNQQSHGNLLFRAVNWLKAPGKYEFARKVFAFAAAFFLCLTIIGIPFVVEGIREWNKNGSSIHNSSSSNQILNNQLQPNNLQSITPLPISTGIHNSSSNQALPNQQSNNLQSIIMPPPISIESLQDPEILFTSLDFSQISPGIHYDEFNNDQEKIELANAARKAIFDVISNNLSGKKDDSNLLNLGKSSIQGWRLDKPISALSDDQILNFQEVEITGKELKQLLLSTTVSYIPQAGLTLAQLKSMLSHGSDTDEQRVLARSRCVSSLVTMLCSPDGKPIQRKTNEKLPLFRMYTLNFPNLRYNVIEADKHQFLLSDGSLNREAYKQEYKRILEHYFTRCQRGGEQVPILSGAGLEAFMPPHLQADAFNAAAEAIEELLKSDKFNQFTGVVFAAFQDQMAQIFEEKLKEVTKVKVVKGSSFWIAYEGAKKGLKMGMINPGDPSCIPGQFWEGGHIALEELIALFTTLILSQHPDFNPLIKDTAHYQATPTSASANPISQSSSAFPIISPPSAKHVQYDRFNSLPLEYFKLNVAGTKEASNLIDAVEIPPLKRTEIFQCRITHEGVSKTIGAISSLLLPDGNSLKKARLQQDIPYVYFDNENGQYRFCINFKSTEYAERLAETLKEIGLKTVKFNPSLEILNQYGFFRGGVSISDPKEIIYFIKYVCLTCPKDLITNSLMSYKTIDLKFANDLRAELSKDLNAVGIFTVIPERRLCLPKEKILANGISQTIGAMTSLLVPGLNSLADAKRLQNILNVSIDPQIGLSLNFEDEESAKEVINALLNPLNDGSFTKMTFASINLQTQYGTYKGSICCKDPETIVRYLRQVCKLHPLDIIDLIQSPNFNTHAHPISESILGKKILSMAKFRLSTESAEDLGGKTVFLDLEKISLNLYKVRLEKLSFSRLPDLSDQEAKRSLGDLKVKLGAILNNCDPSLLEDQGKKCDKGYMKEGMKRFVDVLDGKYPNHYGMPSGEAAKTKWCTSMCLMMKHVLVLLDDTSIDELTKKNLLLSIAAGGQHCAGRYSQEASQAYASLVAQTSNPRYIDPTINKNLCFTDITVIDKCNKLLARMRREIFEKVSALIHVKYQGEDLSHTRNRCMKLIGQDRAIPGAQVADYDDVYGGYAAQVTKENLLKEFDTEYTPEAIVEYFYKNAHFPNEEIGMNPAINGQELADFFGHHAPEEVQNETFGDRMMIMMEDSLLTFKKSYLAQMLQFLDIIAPI